ncbi:hypothetical protein uan_095 [Pseudomonas phage UAntarctica]|nr:hypothetical protein uan_095 [Pseudomonas phage UAntarctica]
MTEGSAALYKTACTRDFTLVADEADNETELKTILIEINIMALKRAATTDTPETEAAVTATTVKAEDKVDNSTAQVDQAALQAAKDQAIADQKAADAAATKKVEDEADNASDEGKEAADAAKPEPETKDEIVPEQAETSAVAVVKEGAVAPGAAPGQVGGAMQAFTAEMAAEGYEGMNLTGMSFDRVKLHEAQFLLGSEDVKLGELIHVQIMSTRSIYVVRQHEGQKAEMFYSYDPAGKFKTDGSSAQETLDEWYEEGYGTDEAPLQIKQYIEGMAMLVNRTDEYDQHMVSLSIPPASKDRLAGAFAVGRQRFRCAPGNLVIECKVGNKVGSGDEAFRPWVFKAHSVAE